MPIGRIGHSLLLFLLVGLCEIGGGWLVWCPIPTSKVAAQSTFTSPVETQSNLAETHARGAKLYATSCQPCHGDRQGKGTASGTSPHNEKGHTWHHPDIQLKDWTLSGKPGFLRDMPAFKAMLKEKDVEAILAFIKTWWTAEQREIQADITRRYQEALEKQKMGR